MTSAIERARKLAQKYVETDRPECEELAADIAKLLERSATGEDDLQEKAIQKLQGVIDAFVVALGYMHGGHYEPDYAKAILTLTSARNDVQGTVQQVLDLLEELKEIEDRRAS